MWAMRGNSGQESKVNYPELLKSILYYGKEVSPRNRTVRELVKVQLTIPPDCNIYAWPGIRPIEKIESYLWEELAWYMSGNRLAKHIAKFAGLWEKIKNSDGTLNSNYGFLVFYNATAHPSLGRVTHTPFEWARRALINDQDSRQAIITYNTGGFNFDGNDDYICTQHQSFLIRNNTLHCFVALRSSDAIFGLTFNMPWWSLVQQQLWLSLRNYYPDLKIGHIEVDIYSAHIYAHHFELVREMTSKKPDYYRLKVENTIPLGALNEERCDLDWYRKNIKNYVSVDGVNQEAANEHKHN
jgi:thymidylate synthase